MGESVVDGPALRNLVLRMSQGDGVAARLKRSASGSLDAQSPAKEANTSATPAAVSTPTTAAPGSVPLAKMDGVLEPPIDIPKEHHEDDDSGDAAPLLALSKSAHRLARGKDKGGDDGSASFSTGEDGEEEIDDDDESADPNPKRRRSSTGRTRKTKEKGAQRTRASTGNPNSSKKPKSGKKGTFSQEEDQLIIELVKKHGAKWSLIKPFVGSSRWTGAQIAQRYRRVLAPREKNIHPRIWSPMEEMRLLANWNSVEMRRWSDAAKHVSTGRCDVSCQYWAGKVTSCQKSVWTKEEDEALVTAAVSHGLHAQPIAIDTAHFEPGKQSRWEAFYTRVCLSLRHTRNSRTPYSLLVRWGELLPYLKNGKLEGVPEGQLPPPIPGATLPTTAATSPGSVSQVASLGLSSSAIPTTPLMVSTVLQGPPIPPPPQVTTQQLTQHLINAQHLMQGLPGTPQTPQQISVRPSDTAASALNDLRSALLSPGQSAQDETMIGGLGGSQM